MRSCCCCLSAYALAVDSADCVSMRQFMLYWRLLMSYFASRQQEAAGARCSWCWSFEKNGGNKLMKVWQQIKHSICHARWTNTLEYLWLFDWVIKMAP